MALLLADGQLANASATLLGAATAERVVAVTLYNTAETDETCVLTVTRSGGTARTVARAVLKGKEALYVTGLPLDPSDVLAGSASSPSTVDYLVAVSAGAFAVSARDANGVPKSSQALEVTLPADTDIDQGTLQVIGLLEEVRDILLKIA